LAAGIDGFGKQWHPAGDWAVIELRTRDVGSSTTPLLGPYSRYGWNHPGPLLFWALSVPYKLVGSSSSSLMLAASLVNSAAIVGLGVFVWRRGRIVLVAATTMGIAVLCSHLGPSFLRDPWNPSMTVLPFALLVVLTWSATDGDRLAVPLLALTGSFLVQSHVGFALVVGTAWVVAAVGYARRGVAWKRPLAWSAAVLVACWLPVLIDQLAGRGNAVDLVRYFKGGATESAAGWSASLGVLARELGGFAPWVGGTERASADGGGLVTGSVWSLLVPVCLFAFALFVARRRGAVGATRFQWVVLALSGAAFVSVARITGPVYAYLVRWLWILALMWWLSILWSLWSATFAGAHDRTSRARSWDVARRWAVVGITVVALVVVTRTSSRTYGGVDRIGTPDGEWYVTLDLVVDDVVARAPRGEQVLVQAVGSNNGSIADGIRLQLERAGVHVVVEDEQVHKYGTDRLASAHSPDSVITVATGALLAGPLGGSLGTPIASWDPLDPAWRDLANGFEDDLADQLSLVGRNDLVTAMRSGGSLAPAHDLDGVDQELLVAVEQLRRRGDPVTVYLDERSSASAVTAG
jgi:hypothetical protein